MLRRAMMSAGGGGPLPGGIPQFLAAGGFSGGASGATVNWPAGHAAGNLGLLMVETANESVPTPAGWTHITSLGTGTPGAAGATMLSVYFKFAASGAEPSVMVADSGDHTFGRMCTFSGVDPLGPVDAYDSTSGVASSLSLPAVTTTGDDRLIVYCVGDSLDAASGFRISGWTNSNLTNLTSRSIGGGTTGVGGGISVATGEMLAAGNAGVGSATHISPTSNYIAITIALHPIGS